MSRFNYSEDEDFSGQFALWAANTERCLKGKKGQAALRQFREALLALPEKRLISELLYDAQGGVCAVGAYMKHVGADMERYDPEDYTDEAGTAAGLPYRVAWTLIELNDMQFKRATPEERYQKMLAWVEGMLDRQAK